MIWRISARCCSENEDCATSDVARMGTVSRVDKRIGRSRLRVARATDLDGGVERKLQSGEKARSVSVLPS